MQNYTGLNEYIEAAIKDNWDRVALADFNGPSFQYRDVARKIAKLHLLFKNANVKPGDKVAICGRNSAHWAMTALACLAYGATAVPILHDFTPATVHHLVNHSGAKLLFVDSSTWDSLDHEQMPNVKGVLLISDYSLLQSRSERLTHARQHLNEFFGREFPERFTPNDVHYYRAKPEEIALLNYTSGSTGFSKGVMLPYRSLWSNVQFAIDHLTWLLPGDGVVCMLPLAHMYGLLVEMIHPFVKGCCINFLTRTPSPRVILEVFAKIKPKLIVAVPLIIEKIIKTRVFPELEKPVMKVLLHIPIIDDRILEKVRAKLDEVFGGNLKQLILGGAPLNKEVELFLRKIHFPYTVGYGMTECGPLVAYEPWDTQRPGSCGRIVDRMEMKVDSPDPANIPGVLYVKGDNVMSGYYKNPDATSAVLSPDGWMNTGDICNVDADGYIYIRGRDKNMILGPSGQNIYPEEIEAMLNNLPYVSESIVIDEDNKLVALIHPDLETASKEGLSQEDLHKIMDSNIRELNPQLPSYSKISRFKLFQEEFEKTPKRSIKRYMYMHK